jgi:hypothetical protein
MSSRIAPVLTISMFVASSMLVASAPAEERFSQAHLQKLLRNKIESVEELAANKSVIRAVQTENEKALSLDRIKEIDAEWVGSANLTPFKKSLQKSEVGRYFKSMVEFNESIYTEIFLTDNKGATVAAYPATSDYWQGDEEKWRQAFNDGSGKVYVGPVSFDESTKEESVQICVPVMVGDEAIGVLIVGLKLTYLQARYLKLD